MHQSINSPKLKEIIKPDIFRTISSSNKLDVENKRNKSLVFNEEGVK